MRLFLVPNANHPLSLFHRNMCQSDLFIRGSGLLASTCRIILEEYVEIANAICQILLI